jgi:acetoin utilization deacetylase AcuC-like enzyme
VRSVWHPDYAFELPDGHPFPMRMYPLLRDLLLKEGLVEPAHWLEATEIPLRLLEQVHTPAYVQGVVSGELDESTRKRLGFPWSPRLVRRSRLAVGGTLLACETALEHGLAANLAGGTHHAFADRGEGYCTFNDVAVALVDLLTRGEIASASVVDLDVHQGNGTAAIFQREPRVRTYSMHGAKNFPLRKEQSTVDVELADGCDDEEYMELLQRTLPRFLEAGAGELVVYLAGVDVTRDDRFGRMGLTGDGVYARDRWVLSELTRRCVPCALVLGGGYLRSGAEATAWLHAHAHRAARDLGL